MKTINILGAKLILLLSEERGDAKFDSAIQIVIAFVIGAVLLAVLGTVFGTTIKTWLTKSASNWFSSTGTTMPPVTTP